jgi:hypothetical protein
MKGKSGRLKEAQGRFTEKLKAEIKRLPGNRESGGGRMGESG